MSSFKSFAVGYEVDSWGTPMAGECKAVTQIVVYHLLCDVTVATRRFATISKARAFAIRHVGAKPEISGTMAWGAQDDNQSHVVMCDGCGIVELFAE